LKHRFEVGASDSLFLNDAEQKNIPIDGFAYFIK